MTNFFSWWGFGGIAPKSQNKHHLIALEIRLEAHILVLAAAAAEVSAAETVAAEAFPPSNIH